MSAADQVVVIFAATNGFLDRIAVDRVPEFHEALVSRMHSENADLLEKIAGGQWEDEIEQALRDAVAEFADDFGYDFDEDGAPIDDGDGDAPRERAEVDSDDDDETADETADEAEEEEAVTA
jgi:F-type H+-transporting ATPase subunit alpha